jgi:hypothetical protein
VVGAVDYGGGDLRRAEGLIERRAHRVQVDERHALLAGDPADGLGVVAEGRDDLAGRVGPTEVEPRSLHIV